MKFRILAAFSFLLSFVGVASAADAIDPNSGSLDVAKAIYEAMRGHQYALTAALCVVLGVALIKRYLGPKIPALHSDVGGTLLTLIGSAAAALVAALSGGGSVTLGMVKDAAMVGASAAGGYAILKKLVVEPLLKPLAAKYPALSWLFDAVFWIFDKPDPVAEAKKAGDAAVAATPPTGAEGAVGKPTEIK